MSSKAVLNELRSVCQGPAFSKSTEAVRLLRFLVQTEQAGETGKLREVLIGAALYGRDAAYDPKLDSVVRVNATRLRARLEEHYAAFPEASLRIVLPKGSYVPHYEKREPSSPTPPHQAESPGEMSVPFGSADPAVPAGVLASSVQPSPGSRPLWLVVGLGSFCLFLLGSAVWWGWTRRVAASGTSWIARPLSRLGGAEQFPVFSPDGRSVVFAWNRSPEEPAALYLQDISSDVPRPLTGVARAETRASWSPDGRHLALVQLKENGFKRILVREVSSDKEIEVATIKGSAPWLCNMPKLSWSTDGRELFTTAETPSSVTPNPRSAERCNIVAIDLSTHAIRPLSKSPPDTLGDVEPTASPDGQTLAFLRVLSYGVVDVYLINLRDNSTRRFTYDNREIMGLTWNPQSRALILAARGQDGTVRLAERDLKTGKTTLLTDGSAPAAFPAISATGRKIAFTSYRSTADIHRISASGDVTLVSDQSLKASPQLSPDGRHLAFSSDRTGFAEIWISDADGRNGVRLTHSEGTGAQKASWFPDSASILFECRDRQHSQICQTKTSGNAEITRLTHWNSDQVLPSLSRDGKRLYYASNRSGRWEAYMQALPDGEPVQLTSGGGIRAVESWDGRAIYIETAKDGVGFLRVPAGYGLIETATLTEKNRLFVHAVPGIPEHRIWNTGSTGVVFFTSDAGRKRLIVLDDNLVKQQIFSVISLPEEIQTLSVTPDGLSVVYSTRARRSGEIDLLEPVS